MKSFSPAGLMVLVAVLGCATQSQPPSQVVETPSVPPAPERPLALTLDTDTLGGAVRRLGEASNRGVVLMNGLESWSVSPQIFQGTPFDSALETITQSAVTKSAAGPAAAQCVVKRFDGYAFVYLPAYEALNELTLRGMLPASYRGVRVNLSFGAATPLYDVFGLLGHTLGVTIVADNAVADQPCGELALHDVPLENALEAILKSARFHRMAFAIEATREFVLIRSIENEIRKDTCLNCDSVSRKTEKALDRKVDVTLPLPQNDPAHFATERGPEKLGNVLDTLSRQLGIRVLTEPGVERLPVNPSALRGVSMRSAMNLVIWQWLEPDFGYEVTDEAILIRHVEQTP